MTQNCSDIPITRFNILLGATILIGIIGGGAYFLLKSKKKSQVSDRKAKKINTENCNVCFAVFNVDDRKSCVPCCICGKIICRGEKCSIWLPRLAGWECKLCNLNKSAVSRTNEWIDRQFITNKYFHPMSKSDIFLPFTENDRRNSLKSLSISNFNSASQSPSLSSYGSQKGRIREHVEDILADMLGGSLDNISVGQLSKSKKYLPLYEAENNYVNTNETTDSITEITHMKLKRLIGKIIEETLRLPSTIDYSGIPSKDSRKRYDDNDNSKYFDPHKYQELLATAVLNKIVDSYNYEKRFENNSETNETKATNLDKNQNSIETKTIWCESSSGDSFEPRSDSSLTDPIRDISKCDNIFSNDSCSNIYTASMNENIEGEPMLSDYIADHKISLPEISTDSESPIEDYLSCPSIGNEKTWEDNWLFKKKNLNSPHSGASVGMLVPAPKEDIKTLIGDRTADEMSDLSDIEEDQIKYDISENDRIQNKTIIGGKGPIGIFDELLEQTSLTSSTSLHENEPIYTETRNDYVLGNDVLSEIGSEQIFDIESGGIPIKNEAINSLMTVKILKNSPPKKMPYMEIENINFEESILPPPSAFNDNQNISSEDDIFTGTVQQKNLLKDTSNAVISCPITPSSNDNTLQNQDDKQTCPANQVKSLRHSAVHFLATVALGPVLTVCTPEVEEQIIKGINDKGLINFKLLTTNEDKSVLKSKSIEKGTEVIEQVKAEETSKLNEKKIEKVKIAELQENNPILTKRNAQCIANKIIENFPKVEVTDKEKIDRTVFVTENKIIVKYDNVSEMVSKQRLNETITEAQVINISSVEKDKVHGKTDLQKNSNSQEVETLIESNIIKETISFVNRENTIDITSKIIHNEDTENEVEQHYEINRSTSNLKNFQALEIIPKLIQSIVLNNTTSDNTEVPGTQFTKTSIQQNNRNNDSKSLHNQTVAGFIKNKRQVVETRANNRLVQQLENNEKQIENQLVTSEMPIKDSKVSGIDSPVEQNTSSKDSTVMTKPQHQAAATEAEFVWNQTVLVHAKADNSVALHMPNSDKKIETETVISEVPATENEAPTNESSTDENISNKDETVMRKSQHNQIVPESEFVENKEAHVLLKEDNSATQPITKNDKGIETELITREIPGKNTEIHTIDSPREEITNCIDLTLMKKLQDQQPVPEPEFIENQKVVVEAQKDNSIAQKITKIDKSVETERITSDILAKYVIAIESPLQDYRSYTDVKTESQYEQAVPKSEFVKNQRIGEVKEYNSFEQKIPSINISIETELIISEMPSTHNAIPLIALSIEESTSRKDETVKTEPQHEQAAPESEFVEKQTIVEAEKDNSVAQQMLSNSASIDTDLIKTEPSKDNDIPEIQSSEEENTSSRDATVIMKVVPKLEFVTKQRTVEAQKDKSHVQQIINHDSTIEHELITKDNESRAVQSSVEENTSIIDTTVKTEHQQEVAVPISGFVENEEIIVETKEDHLVAHEMKNYDTTVDNELITINIQKKTELLISEIKAEDNEIPATDSPIEQNTYSEAITAFAKYQKAVVEAKEDISVARQKTNYDTSIEADLITSKMISNNNETHAIVEEKMSSSAVTEKTDRQHGQVDVPRSGFVENQQLVVKAKEGHSVAQKITNYDTNIDTEIQISEIHARINEISTIDSPIGQNICSKDVTVIIKSEREKTVSESKSAQNQEAVLESKEDNSVLQQMPSNDVNIEVFEAKEDNSVSEQMPSNDVNIETEFVMIKMQAKYIETSTFVSSIKENISNNDAMTKTEHEEAVPESKFVENQELCVKKDDSVAQQMSSNNSTTKSELVISKIPSNYNETPTILLSVEKKTSRKDSSLITKPQYEQVVPESTFLDNQDGVVEPKEDMSVAQQFTNTNKSIVTELIAGARRAKDNKTPAIPSSIEEKTSSKDSTVMTNPQLEESEIVANQKGFVKHQEDKNVPQRLINTDKTIKSELLTCEIQVKHNETDASVMEDNSFTTDVTVKTKPQNEEVVKEYDFVENQEAVVEDNSLPVQMPSNDKYTKSGEVISKRPAKDNETPITSSSVAENISRKDATAMTKPQQEEAVPESEFIDIQEAVVQVKEVNSATQHLPSNEASTEAELVISEIPEKRNKVPEIDSSVELNTYSKDKTVITKFQRKEAVPESESVENQEAFMQVNEDNSVARQIPSNDKSIEVELVIMEIPAKNNQVAAIDSVVQLNMPCKDATVITKPQHEEAVPESESVENQEEIVQVKGDISIAKQIPSNYTNIEVGLVIRKIPAKNNEVPAIDSMVQLNMSCKDATVMIKPHNEEEVPESVSIETQEAVFRVKEDKSAAYQNRNNDAHVQTQIVISARDNEIPVIDSPVELNTSCKDTTVITKSQYKEAVSESESVQNYEGVASVKENNSVEQQMLSNDISLESNLVLSEIPVKNNEVSAIDYMVGLSMPCKDDTVITNVQHEEAVPEFGSVENQEAVFQVKEDKSVTEQTPINNTNIETQIVIPARNNQVPAIDSPLELNMSSKDTTVITTSQHKEAVSETESTKKEGAFVEFKEVNRMAQQMTSNNTSIETEIVTTENRASNIESSIILSLVEENMCNRSVTVITKLQHEPVVPESESVDHQDPLVKAEENYSVAQQLPSNNINIQTEIIINEMPARETETRVCENSVKVNTSCKDTTVTIKPQKEEAIQESEFVENQEAVIQVKEVKSIAQQMSSNDTSIDTSIVRSENLAIDIDSSATKSSLEENTTTKYATLITKLEHEPSVLDSEYVQNKEQIVETEEVDSVTQLMPSNNINIETEMLINEIPSRENETDGCEQIEENTSSKDATKITKHQHEEVLPESEFVENQEVVVQVMEVKSIAQKIPSNDTSIQAELVRIEIPAKDIESSAIETSAEKNTSRKYATLITKLQHEPTVAESGFGKKQEGAVETEKDDNVSQQMPSKNINTETEIVIHFIPARENETRAFDSSVEENSSCKDATVITKPQQQELIPSSEFIENHEAVVQVKVDNSIAQQMSNNHASIKAKLVINGISANDIENSAIGTSVGEKTSRKYANVITKLQHEPAVPQSGFIKNEEALVETEEEGSVAQLMPSNTINIETEIVINEIPAGETETRTFDSLIEENKYTKDATEITEPEYKKSQPQFAFVENQESGVQVKEQNTMPKQMPSNYTSIETELVRSEIPSKDIESSPIELSVEENTSSKYATLITKLLHEPAVPQYRFFKNQEAVVDTEEDDIVAQQMPGNNINIEKEIIINEIPVRETETRTFDSLIEETKSTKDATEITEPKYKESQPDSEFVENQEAVVQVKELKSIAQQMPSNGTSIEAELVRSEIPAKDIERSALESSVGEKTSSKYSNVITKLQHEPAVPQSGFVKNEEALVETEEEGSVAQLMPSNTINIETEIVINEIPAGETETHAFDSSIEENKSTKDATEITEPQYKESQSEFAFVENQELDVQVKEQNTMPKQLPSNYTSIVTELVRSKIPSKDIESSAIELSVEENTSSKYGTLITKLLHEPAVPQSRFFKNQEAIVDTEEDDSVAQQMPGNNINIETEIVINEIPAGETETRTFDYMIEENKCTKDATEITEPQYKESQSESEFVENQEAVVQVKDFKNIAQQMPSNDTSIEAKLVISEIPAKDIESSAIELSVEENTSSKYATLITKLLHEPAVPQSGFFKNEEALVETEEDDSVAQLMPSNNINIETEIVINEIPAGETETRTFDYMMEENKSTKDATEITESQYKESQPESEFVENQEAVVQVNELKSIAQQISSNDTSIETELVRSEIPAKDIESSAIESSVEENTTSKYATVITKLQHEAAVPQSGFIKIQEQIVETEEDDSVPQEMPSNNINIETEIVINEIPSRENVTHGCEFIEGNTSCKDATRRTKPQQEGVVPASQFVENQEVVVQVKEVKSIAQKIPSNDSNTQAELVKIEIPAKDIESSAIQSSAEENTSRKYATLITKLQHEPTVPESGFGKNQEGVVETEEDDSVVQQMPSNTINTETEIVINFILATENETRAFDSSIKENSSCKAATVMKKPQQQELISESEFIENQEVVVQVKGDNSIEQEMSSNRASIKAELVRNGISANDIESSAIESSVREKTSSKYTNVITTLQHEPAEPQSGFAKNQESVVETEEDDSVANQMPRNNINIETEIVINEIFARQIETRTFDFSIEENKSRKDVTGITKPQYEKALPEFEFVENQEVVVQVKEVNSIGQQMPFNDTSIQVELVKSEIPAKDIESSAIESSIEENTSSIYATLITKLQHEPAVPQSGFAKNQEAVVETEEDDSVAQQMPSNNINIETEIVINEIPSREYVTHGCEFIEENTSCKDATRITKPQQEGVVPASQCVENQEVVVPVKEVNTMAQQVTRNDRSLQGEVVRSDIPAKDIESSAIELSVEENASSKYATVIIKLQHEPTVPESEHVVNQEQIIEAEEDDSVAQQMPSNNINIETEIVINEIPSRENETDGCELIEENTSCKDATRIKKPQQKEAVPQSESVENREAVVEGKEDNSVAQQMPSTDTNIETETVINDMPAENQTRGIESSVEENRSSKDATEIRKLQHEQALPGSEFVENQETFVHVKGDKKVVQQITSNDKSIQVELVVSKTTTKDNEIPPIYSPVELNMSCKDAKDFIKSEHDGAIPESEFIENQEAVVQVKEVNSVVHPIPRNDTSIEAELVIGEIAAKDNNFIRIDFLVDLNTCCEGVTMMTKPQQDEVVPESESAEECNSIVQQVPSNDGNLETEFVISKMPAKYIETSTTDSSITHNTSSNNGTLMTKPQHEESEFVENQDLVLKAKEDVRVAEQMSSNAISTKSELLISKMLGGNNENPTIPSLLATTTSSKDASVMIKSQHDESELGKQAVIKTEEASSTGQEMLNNNTSIKTELAGKKVPVNKISSILTNPQQEQTEEVNQSVSIEADEIIVTTKDIQAVQQQMATSESHLQSVGRIRQHEGSSDLPIEHNVCNNDPTVANTLQLEAIATVHDAGTVDTLNLILAVKIDKIVEQQISNVNKNLDIHQQLIDTTKNYHTNSGTNSIIKQKAKNNNDSSIETKSQQRRIVAVKQSEIVQNQMMCGRVKLKHDTLQDNKIRVTDSEIVENNTTNISAVETKNEHDNSLALKFDTNIEIDKNISGLPEKKNTNSDKSKEQNTSNYDSTVETHIEIELTVNNMSSQDNEIAKIAQVQPNLYNNYSDIQNKPQQERSVKEQVVETVMTQVLVAETTAHIENKQEALVGNIGTDICETQENILVWECTNCNKTTKEGMMNSYYNNQNNHTTIESNCAELKKCIVKDEVYKYGCTSDFSDRTSSDSNTTDESTHTVLDADENIITSFVNNDSTNLNQLPGHSNILNNSNTDQTDIITNTNEIKPLKNNTNNPQAKLDSLKKSQFSEHVDCDEDIIETLEHLVPGSIAEREHKKWYNAVEMPNNPYAPEALRRRLSNGPGKTFDIPNINSTTEETLNSLEDPIVSLEGDKTDFTRYSRDYYINENLQTTSPKKRMNILNSVNMDDDDILFKPKNEEVKGIHHHQFCSSNWEIHKPIRRTSSNRSYKSIFDPIEFKSFIYNPLRKPFKSNSNIGLTDISNKILSKFERKLLLNDLKRNSFRGKSSTTENFVLNPIFTNSQIVINSNIRNSIESERSESIESFDIDSGVDSYCSTSINGKM